MVESFAENLFKLIHSWRLVALEARSLLSMEEEKVSSNRCGKSSLALEWSYPNTPEKGNLQLKANSVQCCLKSVIYEM